VFESEKLPVLIILWYGLKELAALEPQNADLEACSEAFSVLQKFRTEEGFK
jgi:hypothetical protein